MGHDTHLQSPTRKQASPSRAFLAQVLTIEAHQESTGAERCHGLVCVFSDYICTVFDQVA